MGIKALLWHANSRRDIEALQMINRVEKYEDSDATNADGLTTPTTPGESASDGYKPYEATPSVTKRQKKKKKKKPNEGSDSSPTTLLQQFVASDASTREVVKEDCKKIAVYFAKITRMMTIDKLKRFCQVDQMKQLIREQRVELYNTLKSWTTGEPRDAIRALGAENIENARDRIKALYAKSPSPLDRKFHLLRFECKREKCTL